MSVPHDTPGAGDAGLPTVEAEASDGLGDPFEVAQAAFNALPPAEETPEDDASSEEPVADASADDADSTAEPDEDADLSQYPEAVREKFKALDPEERKALYEEAEKRAEARIKANEEKTAQLAAQAAEQEARRKEILARTGQHVGAEAQTVTDEYGNEITIPSYEDLKRLMVTRAGRDRLLAEHGLDEIAAERWVKTFEGNQAALDASADFFDDKAWGKLDASLKAGIRAAGLDPDEFLANAHSPQDVIGQLLAHRDAKHEAEKAEMRSEYDGRIEALSKNNEGLRGRALAGSTRRLAEGGRSAGHTNGKVTTQQLIEEAGSVEAYTERAMRGDYAGLNLSRE